jgi:hypothetical protein
MGYILISYQTTMIINIIFMDKTSVFFFYIVLLVEICVNQWRIHNFCLGGGG